MKARAGSGMRSATRVTNAHYSNGRLARQFLWGVPLERRQNAFIVVSLSRGFTPGKGYSAPLGRKTDPLFRSIFHPGRCPGGGKGINSPLLLLQIGNAYPPRVKHLVCCNRVRVWVLVSNENIIATYCRWLFRAYKVTDFNNPYQAKTDQHQDTQSFLWDTLQ